MRFAGVIGEMVASTAGMCDSPVIAPSGDGRGSGGVFITLQSNRAGPPIARRKVGWGVNEPDLSPPIVIRSHLHYRAKGKAIQDDETVQASLVIISSWMICIDVSVTPFRR